MKSIKYRKLNFLETLTLNIIKKGLFFSTIKNPTEGIYKAVIQNDHGMATFECRVLVEVPPQSDQDLPEFMQRSRALLLKSPTPPPIFKPEKQRLTKEESDAVKRMDIAPKIISEFEDVYRLVGEFI